MRGHLFSDKLVLDTVFSGKFKPVPTRAFWRDNFVHVVMVTFNVKNKDWRVILKSSLESTLFNNKKKFWDSNSLILNDPSHYLEQNYQK